MKSSQEGLAGASGYCEHYGLHNNTLGLLRMQVTRHGRNNYVAVMHCDTALPFICKKYEAAAKPKPLPVAPPSTVRHLREDWKTIKQCDFHGKVVELFQHSHYRGWKAQIGAGSFRNLHRKVCDNDKKMCEVKPCNARPNSLTSLKIPSGLAVTIYDHEDFRGQSLTLYGPKNIVGSLHLSLSSLLPPFHPTPFFPPTHPFAVLLPPLSLPPFFMPCTCTHVEAGTCF